MQRENPGPFRRHDILEGFISGNLDSAAVAEEGGVLLMGWAYDPRTNSPARSVLILDNGRQYPLSVQVYRPRPDVAAFKSNRSLIDTGWLLWMPPERLPKGAHRLEAFAVFVDGKLARLGSAALVVNGSEGMSTMD